MKRSSKLQVPFLPEIDPINPNITDLLFINHQLKRAFLNLKKESLQQSLNIDRISKEKQQLSREIYTNEAFMSIRADKNIKNEKFLNKKPNLEKNDEKLVKIEKNQKTPKKPENQENFTKSILSQKSQNTQTIESPTKITNFEGKPVFLQELELTYRDKLNESEKLKDKYYNKYKTYKQSYPKDEYERLKQLSEEKEKEMNKIKLQLHELQQTSYQITEENNNLRKEYYDMETKNGLLMEELSIMAEQNNDLINENAALKGVEDNSTNVID